VGGLQIRFAIKNIKKNIRDSTMSTMAGQS
jgi:hypothetical protein